MWSQGLTGCVDDREPQFDSLLLDLHGRLLDLGGPFDPVIHTRYFSVRVEI